MKKVVIPSLLFIVAAVSCGGKAEQKPAYEQLGKANWLLGKWGSITPEGTLVETWKRANDSTFAGKTHFVLGTDTVFTETISLEQRGKDVHYITQVSDQNAGKPIPFKMTSASEKELVFENPKHDFPQKITYTAKGDSLIAVISGVDKGKKASERFPMGKLK